jgi:membrane protease YdiL (CAAX protease family)
MKVAALVVAALVLLAAGFQAPVLDTWSRMIIATGTLGAIGLAAMKDRRIRFGASPVDVPIGLAGALLLAAGAWLALTIPFVGAWALEMFRWKEGHSTATLVATLVIAVAGEEIFWRGCLLEELAAKQPMVNAVVAGALINGAVHAASGSVLLALAGFGTSLFWGGLYALTRQLAAPFVCHLAFDLFAIFLLPRLIPHTGP